MTAPFPVAASEVDLLRLFETAAIAEPRYPADVLVARAFENLLPSGFMMEIDIVRTDPAGTPSSSGLRVYRKQIGDSLHTLTESTRPPRVAGTRMLQVEPEIGPIRTYTYIRSASSEPMEVPFQLMEPFLGMWHERPELEPSEDRVEGGAFEILARRPDMLGGERVQRILVRPRTPLGYDRIELAIAEDFAILELLYFADATSPGASLVARALRSDMQRIGGYVLPSVLRYEDRAMGQEIQVTIAHAPVPEDTSDALFSPRTFHRTRTTAPSSADGAPPSSTPRP